MHRSLATFPHHQMAAGDTLFLRHDRRSGAYLWGFTLRRRLPSAEETPAPTCRCSTAPADTPAALPQLPTDKRPQASPTADPGHRSPQAKTTRSRGESPDGVGAPPATSAPPTQPLAGQPQPREPPAPSPAVPASSVPATPCLPGHQRTPKPPDAQVPAASRALVTTALAPRAAVDSKRGDSKSIQGEQSRRTDEPAGASTPAEPRGDAGEAQRPLFAGLVVVFHVHSHQGVLKRQLAAHGATVGHHDERGCPWAAATHVVTLPERLPALSTATSLPQLLERRPPVALVTPAYFSDCLAARALLPVSRRYSIAPDTAAREEPPKAGPPKRPPATSSGASTPGAPDLLLRLQQLRASIPLRVTAKKIDRCHMIFKVGHTTVFHVCTVLDNSKCCSR